MTDEATDVQTSAHAPTVWTELKASQAWALFEDLILDNGKRWGDAGQMQPWQKDAFAATLGLPPVEGYPSAPAQTQLWLEGPTGSGKDQIIAAVVLAFCMYAPDGCMALCYSSDRERCEDVVTTVRGFISRTDRLPKMRNRRMGKRLQVLEQEIRRVAKQALPIRKDRDRTGRGGKRPTQVSVRIESLDGASASGSRADLYLMNEVQSWPDPNGPRVWDESIARYDKIDHGRFAVFSNAPFTPPGDFRRDERDKAQAGGDANPWWFRGVTLKDCPWWTPAKLEKKRATVAPHVWRRLYLCIATDGRGELVTPEEYDRCIDHRWQEQRVASPSAIYFHALDASTSRDHAVHLVLHRNLADFRIYVDAIRIWLPATGQQINLDEVERHAEESLQMFPGTLWADPYQAVQMCQRLARKFGEDNVTQVQFNPDNLTKMCEAVRSAIRDKKLVVWPDIGTVTVSSRTTTSLRRQVLEAEVVEQEKGSRIKSKRTKQGHGDQLSALALALFGLTKAGIVGASMVTAVSPEARRREEAESHPRWLHRHAGRYLGPRSEGLRRVPRWATN